jgi:transposase
MWSVFDFREEPHLLAVLEQACRTRDEIDRLELEMAGDHHASNGPTEAINGRLEALRRNALGFRNLTHYRLRSLLHCGALHHAINAL